MKFSRNYCIFDVVSFYSVCLFRKNENEHTMWKTHSRQEKWFIQWETVTCNRASNTDTKKKYWNKSVTIEKAREQRLKWLDFFGVCLFYLETNDICLINVVYGVIYSVQKKTAALLSSVSHSFFFVDNIFHFFYSFIFYSISQTVPFFYINFILCVFFSHFLHMKKSVK